MLRITTSAEYVYLYDVAGHLLISAKAEAGNVSLEIGKLSPGEHVLKYWYGKASGYERISIVF
jgi:hypothetical protein